MLKTNIYTKNLQTTKKNNIDNIMNRLYVEFDDYIHSIQYELFNSSFNYFYFNCSYWLNLDDITNSSIFNKLIEHIKNKYKCHAIYTKISIDDNNRLYDDSNKQRIKVIENDEDLPYMNTYYMYHLLNKQNKQHILNNNKYIIKVTLT